MVTVGNPVADVGTDHGYVPIYLVLNNIAPYAIAMDINEGPLSKAKDNIKAYGLEEKIATRLSDGLEMLNKNEVDTVIISGMGGQLIIEILKKHEELLCDIKELVLLPHREVEEVRRYLHTIGFVINDECVVKEDGKFYQIVKASKGALKEYSKLEYMFGPCNLSKKDEIFRELLIFEKSKATRLLNELKNNNTENAFERSKKLQELIEIIDKGLDLYEM